VKVNLKKSVLHRFICCPELIGNIVAQQLLTDELTYRLTDQSIAV